MDRISQLPDGIIHHILLFINTPEELVRMSVLSKHWFHLTASFPLLDFTFYKFRPQTREIFFKYVEYTTSRFCQQNVIANKFKFDIWIQNPAELDIVNRCLQLVLENGVRKLVIKLTNSSQKYRLPDVLLSVSVLKYLKIAGCELPSSLMVDAIKFKSLIKLKLIRVTLDDEVIKYLTTSCPLLETFEIQNCHGFKRFRVSGHQNLRRVLIDYFTQVESINIKAPNLSEFLVKDTIEIGTPKMNLASCKKLTTVSCQRLVVNTNGFHDILSSFPFIENLDLVTDKRCKNLKFSCDSLRTLVLHSNSCDFKDIEFNTPNLVLFAYGHIYRAMSPLLKGKQWPLLRDSNGLKPCMHCYVDKGINSLWFQKLRQFLDKKKGFKVLNLYINAIYNQNFIALHKQKLIELPPYELEHVELQVFTDRKSSTNIAFVDAILWCCRPRSLTLRSAFPLTDFEDIVKFTYEKLLEQEDKGVTNIQIVLPSSSQAQKQLRDLKSISIGLPRDQNAISFTKLEVIVLNPDDDVMTVYIGCGANFKVEIVFEQFEGKRLLERHRMVNGALADEMKDIHALSITKVLTPDQWNKQQQQPQTSHPVA